MVLSQRYTEYNNWAWLYNETMGPQYSQSQLCPLQTLLLSNLPPNAHLLDLCCGTGHLVQALVEKGYQVTGLDGSDEMIHYAQQNAPSSKFIISDARHFNLPHQFHAAYSMSASLNHMMSISDLIAVFQSVYHSLQKDGLFLFDLNHPQQMQKWWVDRVVEGEIHPTYAWCLTPVYNADSQTGYFQISLFRSPPTKPGLLQTLKSWFYRAIAHPFSTRLRLRILSQFSTWQPDWQRSDIRYHVSGYSESQVLAALQAAGFSEITTSNLNGHPTIDDNHSIYFLCRKLNRSHSADRSTQGAV
jgi:ubiquinone/menaquinone biosynthesis C-methylase UbiE